MHVCFRCVWFRFSALRQEIGWEERLRDDLFCRVERKTLIDQSMHMYTGCLIDYLMKCHHHMTARWLSVMLPWLTVGGYVSVGRRSELQWEYTQPAGVKCRPVRPPFVDVRSLTADDLEHLDDLARHSLAVHVPPQPRDHPRSDPPPRGRTRPGRQPGLPPWWRWTGGVELVVAGRSADGVVRRPVDDIQELCRSSQLVNRTSDHHVRTRNWIRCLLPTRVSYAGDGIISPQNVERQMSVRMQIVLPGFACCYVQLPVEQFG